MYKVGARVLNTFESSLSMTVCQSSDFSKHGGEKKISLEDVQPRRKLRFDTGTIIENYCWSAKTDS